MNITFAITILFLRRNAIALNEILILICFQNAATLLTFPAVMLIWIAISDIA